MFYLKTIALRFGDNFAPEPGTIALHKQVIEEKSYVWYGKFGNAISKKNETTIMQNDKPRILLIKSGCADRYWAYISDIKRTLSDDELDNVPSYYRDRSNTIKCWFKIEKIEVADNKVMSKCIISSTGNPLSNSSKHSMNPFFIIDYQEDEND